MGALFCWTGPGALSVIQIALIVSGFAGPDGGMRSARLRSSHDAAREYRSVAAPAFVDVRLPPNLAVPAAYQDLLRAMRDRSPTFRRQLVRIENARHVTIALRLSVPPAHLHMQGWTRIARDPEGRLTAVIHVPPVTGTAELIAHELEHVIEQIDGIDLHTKARQRFTGVRECDCGEPGTFETGRAVHVGLRVAREVGGGNP